ncbi:hypothetical protein [Serratia phage PCH45]|uniref:hypothetical protein n=1 Tax=Serratia phage PCH45 TaxID=2608368 RepID=UPI0012A8B821|nr:hypothetical protein [Serratia phage PCH45]
MEQTRLPTMRMYRHYKGGEYLLIAIANEGSDREGFEPTAVYHSLKEGKIYSRALSEFSDKFTLIEPEEKVIPVIVQHGASITISTELGCFNRPFRAAEIPEALFVAFNKDIAFEL